MPVMQRTVSLKLLDAPDAECRAMVEAYRDACQTVSSAIAHGERANARALHGNHYGTLRKTLPAQISESVFRTVVGAWKSWRSNGSRGDPPAFRRSFAVLQGGPRGRDWGLKPDGTVSFRLLGRRARVAYQTGTIGIERLTAAKAVDGLGGTRLVHKRKGWFLEVSVNLPTPAAAYAPATTVGVDVGLNVLAVARAPGARPFVVRGGDVRRHRNDAYRLRRRLQGKGTRSARRVLEAQSGREQRFCQDRVRVAAKAIVAYAKSHNAAIRLEDLTGIRVGKRCGRDGNRRLHSWAYRRLQQAVAHRAEAEGVPLAWVEPAYTSQACPRCAHTAKANRDGARFECRSCGYRNHADIVGATNIALKPALAKVEGARGRVNGPDERGGDGLVLLHTVPIPVQATDFNRW